MVKGGIGMNKRGTGTVFCLIAALLYSVRYLCAAIYGSGESTTWIGGLDYVGYSIIAFSLISLVIGIVYLISAEREERKGKDIKEPTN